VNKELSLDISDRKCNYSMVKSTYKFKGELYEIRETALLTFSML